MNIHKNILRELLMNNLNKKKKINLHEKENITK